LVQQQSLRAGPALVGRRHHVDLIDQLPVSGGPHAALLGDLLFVETSYLTTDGHGASFDLDGDTS